MSNDAKKVSELGITASLSANDRLVVLTNPSSTPVTQTITLTNLVANSIPKANTSAFGVIKVGENLSVNATGFLNGAGGGLPTSGQSEGFAVTWDTVTNSAIWQSFSGVRDFKIIDADTYTVAEHDNVLFADPNSVSNNITIVLPDSASDPTATSGKTYIVKNINPGDGPYYVRVTTYSGQEFNSNYLENPVTGSFSVYYDIELKGDEQGWIFDGTVWRHFGSKTGLPFFTGDANTFTELSIKNRSSGTDASADISAYNDLGNQVTGDGPYVDMGINSSEYNNAEYSVGGPSDGYLYSTGGNLTVGTHDSSANLIFHTGGSTAANTRMTIADDRVDVSVNNFTFSGVAGPFINDSAAATGGVLLKGFYYDSSGNVKIRLT